MIEKVLAAAGAILAEKAVFLLTAELPSGSGDAEMEVPGLHEDALLLLVEPLKEHEVLEAGRHLKCGQGRGRGTEGSAAAWETDDTIGAGHEAGVAILDGVERFNGF